MKNIGVSTKIEFSFNKIARIEGIDELASALFPGNRRHQRLFLAIFVELKYAADQFLPSLDWIAEEYGSSRRVLEIVRSKMRRLGIIDHVSRFNGKHGYREGWVFSNRLSRSLERIDDLVGRFRQRRGDLQERKDRDVFRYLG